MGEHGTFQTYLDQVNEIEARVMYLEQVAQELDQYSLQLGRAICLL
jgi:hypothetical protein